jgi:hypothetical protein
MDTVKPDDKDMAIAMLMQQRNEALNKIVDLQIQIMKLQPKEQPNDNQRDK